MSIQVTVEATDLRVVATRLEKAVKRLVRSSGDYAEQQMRKRAPKRTGRLRKSIRKRVNLATLEVEVGPTVPYAVYVEYGTRPHTITPVRAEALRFQVGTTVVFAKLVRHPGTKPRWFIRETQEAVQKRIARLWKF